ncbi:MAG TPA: HD domain-containing phosphohydrolase [Rhodocyclaceae bacterium]
MADLKRSLFQAPDPDMLREFYESLTDKTPTIERDVARLRRNPTERDLIADLFRAIHNIKGDAAITKVEVGIRIAHPIETLLSRTREGSLGFTDMMAESILLALDRLELATEALVERRAMDNLKLPEMIAGLEALCDLPADKLDAAIAQVIENVTGFRPRQSPLPNKATTAAPTRTRGSSDVDLRLFRQLALQLETRSILFKGRYGRLLRLALDTNAVAGKPVDPVQLEAAVYFHDIGMMFLPEAAWLTVERLSMENLASLRNHPAWAAELLDRMDGWSEAAQMVRQHHEMPDGRGYPAGLEGEAIVPGAKILSIIDAFESVTLKHSHRGQNRSLLRAIAEINACDKQFDPAWIGHFNQVIRKMVEA